MDNWTPLLSDSLDGAWPPANCGVSHANADGSDREWGQVGDVRYVSPWNAAWPAAQGADRIMPPANYPPGIQTWIVCGAYDLSDAQKFFVQYDLWIDIVDPNDAFTFAYSVDNGATWTFYDYPTSPVSHDWTTYAWWLNELTGNAQVVVAFGLRSYIDAMTAEGPWLDNLRIWKYTTPSLTCGAQDSGRIGLNLGPYNSADGAIVISGTDTRTLQQLQDSNVKWVRLEFAQNGGFVDLQGFDRIIDSLCAAGISTQGIVDYATLSRTDWNTNPAAYRQVFSDYAAFLADYFNGRVKYWEVWNEPHGLGDMLAINFADLLNDTSNAIRAANGNTRIIYGGLGSAWLGTAYPYFNDVYLALNGIVGQSQPKPFDFFADHPYPDFNHPINPDTYFYQDIGNSQPVGGYPPTILNKFFDQMALNGDAGKKTWVTEIGWNGNSAAPPDTQGCTLSTTRGQQAIFMKLGFDILLDKTLLPDGTLAIDKVMWFGYSDFSVPNQNCNNQIITQAAWYGLYGQDRATANQPTQCVFANYPQWERCIDFRYVFLPAVTNGDTLLLSPSTPTP